MQVTITFRPSLEKLAGAFDSVNVQSILQDTIKKIAFAVERTSKQLTPVDTGRLRASIHTQPMLDWAQAKVSTNTEYAIFVHEGTRYMRGRPFMTQAVDMVKSDFEGSLITRIDEEFTKAFKKL